MLDIEPMCRIFKGIYNGFYFETPPKKKGYRFRVRDAVKYTHKFCVLTTVYYKLRVVHRVGNQIQNAG